MTDLIQRLAEIREMQGKEPLPDPTVIEGGPLPPRPPRDEDPDFEPNFPDEEVREPMPPPSPLHQLGRVPPPSPAPSPPQGFPVPDLAVAAFDSGARIASYKGQEVELTEKEAVAVRTVVVRALQRYYRAKATELDGARTRRKRRKAEVASGAEGGDRAAPPKRRGRPRKVQP